MKELIKKFGGFSLGPMAGAVISFITVPLITYFISPEEYGKTSMFTVAQGMVSMIVYLGMDQAFVREFNAAKDNMAKLMTNAISIPLISVVILDMVALLFSNQVSMLLFDSPDELGAVYMMVLMFPFMIIENFSLLKIRMEEKGLMYSAFTILLKVCILAFTVMFFFLYEKSFRSVVYAMALGEIVNGIVLYFIAIRSMNLKLSYLDKALMNRMLKFGLPLIPASLLGWALTSMDKIMLRSMCTYEALGLYTAAFKIVSILSIVQTCFTLFWTPVAYRWYESNADKKNFANVNKLVAVVMVCMCFGLLLFKDLVAFVLGQSFTEAIYIFPFLLLNPIMYTMSESTCVGIGFTRKTHYTIVVSTASGVLNIILNYLLIPIMGGQGAALATGLSYVVFFWVRTLISRNLWWKFPITGYMVYTALVLINCSMHTFVMGYIPYVVSAVSILAVLVFNAKDIIVILKNMKDIGN